MCHKCGMCSPCRCCNSSQASCWYVRPLVFSYLCFLMNRYSLFFFTLLTGFCSCNMLLSDRKRICYTRPNQGRRAGIIVFLSKFILFHCYYSYVAWQKCIQFVAQLCFISSPLMQNVWFVKKTFGFFK